MNVKFSELKLKILRGIADEPVEGETPIGGASYSADQLKDAVHAALMAITSRSWKAAEFDIPGEVTEEDLPDDCIDIESVFDITLDIFIPKMSFSVGNALSSASGNAWHTFPHGKISFVNEVGESGAKAYYSAHWTLPSKESDLIEAPENTLTCIILYAMSHVLLSDAAASGQIRQFNTKVDAGAPSDIPAIKVSNFFLQRFEQELARLPMMGRSRKQ